MSALNNRQKWVLVDMARRAFNLAGAQARGMRREARGEHEGSFCVGRNDTLQDALNALAANGSEGCFETWRHEQVKLACGKNGLRLCSQLDYKAVEAHFQHLLGEDGRAFVADQRHQTEAVRQARHKLNEALERNGFHVSYAEVICRKQFKVELDGAAAQQLWKIVYTVNKRGAARRRQEREEVVA